MKDAQTSFVNALPNAAANANSNVLDLDPEAAGFLTNQWRLGYVAIGLPALPGHSNTSSNITVKLQDSADNGNWADTQPVIQVVLPGVANGTAALTTKVPFNPAVRRYVRFQMSATANANTGPNSNTTFDLVV